MSGFEYFKIAFHLHGNISDFSQISSNPNHVCLCNSTTINCDVINYDTTAYPGQTFYIPTVAAGQMLGTVPSIILSKLLGNSRDTILGDLEQIQQVQRTCTDIHFTVFSINAVERILLKFFESPDTPQEIVYRPWFAYGPELLSYSRLFLTVTLLPCPLAFVLQDGSCDNCHPTLLKYNI